MTASLRTEWKRLRRSRPGHRFQDRFEANDGKGANRSMVARFGRLVIAIIAFAIGLVLIFIPGPAILFFLIAGGLLAAESRHVARFLDWSEVKLRHGLSWLWARWRSFSRPEKMLVALLVAAGGAGGLFVSYRIVLG